MLDESGRRIFGADSFLVASGLTCFASQPPRRLGLYLGASVSGDLPRPFVNTSSKYFSNSFVATARCSRHCAMLHCSTDGFQLSWVSVSSPARVSAVSLFLSAASATVCKKSADSKNGFIELIIRMLPQLSRWLRIRPDRESFSFPRLPIPTLRPWYRSAARCAPPPRGGNQQ